MDIILYNPLSNNGKNAKLITNLEKKLTKKGIKVKSYNLLEITDVRQFIDRRQNVRRFILIGGDGTISRVANEIYGLKIKPGIFVYKAGTGNDFIRSLERRKGLIDIKRFLKDLPKITVYDKETYFLNGVGLGLDGLVCHKVNHSKHRKNKRNYFRHALEAFREFKPKKAQVILDNDLELNVNDAFFVSVMNSKFFGGGMKIAPKANRSNDDLQVVIINKIPKVLLFILIPTIYLGIHVMFKKYVSIYNAKEVLITFDSGEYLQIDGETSADIKQIRVVK